MHRPSGRSAEDGPGVVVAGWAGAGNIGDELLARWVILQLRGHGMRPVLLSSDPKASAEIHSVEAVDGRSLRAVTTAIRRADGMVFGPGGLVQDSSSVWSLPFHLWRPFVAGRSSKPWVAVGLGVEPLGRRLSRSLVRRMMSHAVAVTVRDIESAKLLEALDLDVEVGDDVVFGLPASTDRRRDVIAVAVGPEIDQSSSRWRTAAGRLGGTDVESIASALVSVRASIGFPVVLAAFRGRRDFEFASRIAEAMSDGAEVEKVDIDNAASWCASAGVVITSRFHPAVMAVAHNSPVVVWPRSPKIESLASQCLQRVVSAPPGRWVAAVDEARRLHVAVSPYRSDTGPHERAVAALVQRIESGS